MQGHMVDVCLDNWPPIGSFFSPFEHNSLRNVFYGLADCPNLKMQPAVGGIRVAKAEDMSKQTAGAGNAKKAVRHVLREQEDAFLRGGKAEIEIFTQKRTETLPNWSRDWSIGCGRHPWK